MSERVLERANQQAQSSAHWRANAGEDSSHARGCTNEQRAVAAYTFLPWVQQGLRGRSRPPMTPGAASPARSRCRWRCRSTVAGDVAHGRAALRARRRHRARPAPDRAHRPAAGRDELRGHLPRRPSSSPRADLPWLFTPATASADGRLRPWLALVVVRRQDGVRLSPNPAGPLPVLEIAAPARAADELPDLAQSWAWAHAQIAGLPAGQDPADILATGAGARHLAAAVPPAPGARDPLPRLRRADVRPRRAGRPRQGDRRRRRGPAGAGLDARRRCPTRCACPSTTRGSSRPAPPAASSRSSAASSPRAAAARVDASCRPRRERRRGRPARRSPRRRRARSAPLESAMRVPGPDAPPPWPDEGRRAAPGRRSSACWTTPPGGVADAAGLRPGPGGSGRSARRRRAPGVAARAQPRPAAPGRRRRPGRAWSRTARRS